MNIILKISKWGIGILMSLLLLVCITDLLTAGYVFKSPHGIADLTWINATIRDVRLERSTGLSLTLEETPVIFYATLDPDQAEKLKQVMAGDSVSLEVRKEDKEHLDDEQMA